MAKSTSTTDGPPPAIQIFYWRGETDLHGGGAFEQEVIASYPDVMFSHQPGGLGGGLYTLFVQIRSSLTFDHVIQVVIDGVAFDLIKLALNRYALRPLLEAQRKLAENNKPGADGDIASLIIRFADTLVIIDADSRVTQKISESVNELFELLARHRQQMLLPSNENPTEIYIPIVEDTRSTRVARFRAVLEVDEELKISEGVLFEHWGLRYGSGEVRVYDVVKKRLLPDLYITRKEYWAAMKQRWAYDRESSQRRPS